jgi:Ca2+/Na+ antiporter
VAAIAQRRPNLALGNILGSSISNILGAFALGLLFHPGRTTFDSSSKIYTAVLLAVTSLFVVFLACFEWLMNISGPILIALFIVYVVSIAYGIYAGAMSAPVDSDSDSDTNSDSDSNSEEQSQEERGAGSHLQNLPQYLALPNKEQYEETSPSTSMFPEEGLPRVEEAKSRYRNKRPKRLIYYISQLFLGFLALSISCYVLSHSISAFGDELGLSNSLMGVTILSLATTLPEKVIAIMSGAKGESGIVIANTVGSNIFLLTLCAGILFVSGDLSTLATGIRLSELGIVWASAVLLSLAVFLGADRRVGAVFMTLYIGFLVAEFTVFRSV